MYTVLQYGQMVADRARMEAYAAALRRVLRPGARVLDVGTGTGIFALLACRLGASRVLAVDPAPAIEAARALAAANGMAERIEFVRAPLEELPARERVDVIVSDLRGALPFAGRHLPTLRLARERFLAPGGTLLPLRDDVFAVPLEAPELYASHVTRWTENPWQLDMEPAREVVVNTLWSGAGRPGRALAEPAHVARVDYTGPLEPDLRTRLAFAVAEEGTLHALLLWFDGQVADGVAFSNALDEPDHVYGRVVLPLREPLAVHPGERVDVALQAVLEGDAYVWSWATELRGRDGRVRASLRQSTFLAGLHAAEELRARDLDARPQLGETARVDRFVLCLVDGRRRLEDVARAAAERFPARFGSLREARAHVTRLLVRYGAPAQRGTSSAAPVAGAGRRRRAAAAPAPSAPA